jgi:hypothetical protein
MSFYIPYALPHVTVATVKDTFEAIFEGDVKVNELMRKDRDTGRDFKIFWITVDGGNKHIDFFIDEINSAGSAKITYERSKRQDRYWQVKLNINKPKTHSEPAEPFKPRILKRESAEASTEA